MFYSLLDNCNMETLERFRNCLSDFELVMPPVCVAQNAFTNNQVNKVSSPPVSTQSDVETDVSTIEVSKEIKLGATNSAEASVPPSSFDELWESVIKYHQFQSTKILSQLEVVTLLGDLNFQGYYFDLVTSTHSTSDHVVAMSLTQVREFITNHQANWFVADHAHDNSLHKRLVANHGATLVFAKTISKALKVQHEYEYARIKKGKVLFYSNYFRALTAVSMTIDVAACESQDQWCVDSKSSCSF
jgi:hypothetical protein